MGKVGIGQLSPDNVKVGVVLEVAESQWRCIYKGMSMKM